MSHICSQKDIRKQKKQTKSYSKRLRYEKSQSSNSGIQKLQITASKQNMLTGENKTQCLYCSEMSSDSTKGEIWVQGDEYVQWTYKECAGYDRGGGFTCDFCDDDYSR